MILYRSSYVRAWDPEGAPLFEVRYDTTRRGAHQIYKEIERDVVESKGSFITVERLVFKDLHTQYHLEEVLASALNHSITDGLLAASLLSRDTIGLIDEDGTRVVPFHTN